MFENTCFFGNHVNCVFRERKNKKKEELLNVLWKLTSQICDCGPKLHPKEKKKMFHSSIKHFRKESKYRKCDKIGLFFFFSTKQNTRWCFCVVIFQPSKKAKTKAGLHPIIPCSSTPSSSLFQPGILQPVWGPPGRPPTP